MKSARITSAITTIVFIGMLLLPDFIQAQAPAPSRGLGQSLSQYHDFDEGFSIGASVNYGGKYFESDSGGLNDFWSSAIGFGLHFTYSYPLSPAFALGTGSTLFVNRYTFEEQRMPWTDETGQPTGPEIVASMDGAASTTYIGLPVNLVIRPLSDRSFFLALGPEVGFRVGYRNGTIITREDPPGDGTENGNGFDGAIFDENYDVPEQSEDLVLFVNAGLGYSIDSLRFPLDISLGLRQSATNYITEDNFADTWLRHLTFTVSYRL